jgi:hypothetical protein
MSTYEAKMQAVNDVLVKIGLCEEGQRVPKIEAMFVEAIEQVEREREYAI